MSDLVFLVAATLLGGTIGSFLNVVIHRLPREDLDVMGLRSACPHCRKTIPLYLNVPVLAWIFLRGRTRCCGEPLSIRYPTVEALTAGLFLLLAFMPPSHLPLLVDGLRIDAVATFALHGFFVASLIANTFIDIDFRILPDVLTKSLMAVGVAGCLLVPELAGAGLVTSDSTIAPAANGLLFSLAGLLTGLGSTWAVRSLAKATFRREAMGLGDVKLMGGIGAFLGWEGALTTFFLGCLFGAVGGAVQKRLTKDPYVAFGPYLALGAVVTLFWGDVVLAFVKYTWPEWQREHASSPLVVVVVGVVSVVVLILLVRRGRSN